MIVVDAHVIIYLVYETSFSPLARDARAKDPEWVAPEIWESEVLNGMRNELRAGRTRRDDAIRAADGAAAVLAGKVHRCDRSLVLRTAEESRLTVYDAYYVALARSLGVVLVTEDRGIRANCPDVARSLRAFLGLPEEPPETPRPRSACVRSSIPAMLNED
jgi:predicted nucleic acid-binding protein